MVIIRRYRICPDCTPQTIYVEEVESLSALRALDEHIKEEKLKPKSGTGDDLDAIAFLGTEDEFDHYVEAFVKVVR